MALHHQIWFHVKYGKELKCTCFNSETTESLQCHLCEFTTTSKAHLKVHISFHKTCEICGMNFSGVRGKRLLESHMKKHEVKVQTYHECGKCHKKFLFKCRLKEHMKTKKCSPT